MPIRPGGGGGGEKGCEFFMEIIHFIGTRTAFVLVRPYFEQAVEPKYQEKHCRSYQELQYFLVTLIVQCNLKFDNYVNGELRPLLHSIMCILHCFCLVDVNTACTSNLILI